MTVIIPPEERSPSHAAHAFSIVGPFGVGKTSLLRSLNSSTALFVDVEHGSLAVDDVPVPHIRPETWPEIRDVIVRIAGPNRSFQPHEPFSQAHFDRVGGPLPGHYTTVFFDTVTAASRLSFRWASAQPEAFSERTGKPDQRGAYGLHAREMLLALHHLQSARGLNVILIGALETASDEYGRVDHRLQAEGQRVPREIAGIVDVVVTMNWLNFNDDKPAQRGFVCTSPNAWSFPGKDRSGRLSQLEPPDLGALIAKVLPPRANHGAAAAQSPPAPPLRQQPQQAKEKAHDA